MKRICILLLCLLSVTSLFANVKVKDFFGKVKVRYAGDSNWSQIEIGQELPANTLVSTGFNSQIVLDMGNATLDVLPLTRMTINEISESQGTIKTDLFLKGGKIRADVGKIEGKINDFKIKSPVATASVRGTAFDFTGNSLNVIRGLVAFYPTPLEDIVAQKNRERAAADEARERKDPVEVVDSDATVDFEGEADSASDDIGDGEVVTTDQEDNVVDSEGGDDSGSDAGVAEVDISTGDSVSDAVASAVSVAVSAGGSTVLSSVSSNPVTPEAMIQAASSVSASTKPVIVDSVSSVVEAVVEEVLTAAEVLSSTSNTATITITINPIEE